MRERWEMYTVSRMQNIVQIRTENTYFMTKQLLYFSKFLLLGLSASRAPAEGPLLNYIYIYIYIKRKTINVFIHIFIPLLSMA